MEARDEEYRGPSAKLRIIHFIQELIEGEPEVEIPKQADRAFNYVVANPSLARGFLQESMQELAYQASQVAVASGRQRKFFIGERRDRKYSREEMIEIVRKRANKKSIFSNWYEQTDEMSVLFRHLDKKHGLQAADIRARRATREGQHAVAIHDQVRDLPPGETIGEAKSDEDILLEMGESAARTLDLTFEEMGEMIKDAKEE